MSLKTSSLAEFSPPGNLQDLTPENKAIWSKQYISYWMTGEINADPNVVSPGRTKLSQYFNGTVVPFDQSQQPTPVTWTAFPNLVIRAFGQNVPLRWQIADSSRIFQDEYLEWSVLRDSTKNIISVTYTCEGPEYWQVLASYQKADALKLIKTLNAPLSTAMQDQDFFLTDPATGNQVYNPQNYWNDLTTNGTIMHLIHPSNTLSAEIDIAAQATVIRKDSSGNVITDPQQLIQCSKYGNPGRNSDPTIGGTINSVARQKNSIMVADPVALYIHSFNTSSFQLDTGGTTDPANPNNLINIPSGVFNWQRGDITKHQGLRLQVTIPSTVTGKNGQALNVSNIWDKNTKKHIKYGAQFADYITMSVSAVTISAPVADPIPCYNPSATAPASVAVVAGSAAPAAAIAIEDSDETKVEERIFPFPKMIGRKYA